MHGAPAIAGLGTIRCTQLSPTSEEVVFTIRIHDLQVVTEKPYHCSKAHRP